jgi:hypothetical protein
MNDSAAEGQVTTTGLAESLAQQRLTCDCASFFHSTAFLASSHIASNMCEDLGLQTKRANVLAVIVRGLRADGAGELDVADTKIAEHGCDLDLVKLPHIWQRSWRILMHM